MNRTSSVAAAILVCVPAFAPLCGRACPKLPERDPVAPFLAGPGARAVIVEYFAASKNADAARAASLIDYEEWTKELGLEGEAAKIWVRRHQAELVADYRKQKAAGSSKDFRITKVEVKYCTAVFEVSQDRVNGVHNWRVRLMCKAGRWAITGFDLLGIKR